MLAYKNKCLLIKILEDNEDFEIDTVTLSCAEAIFCKKDYC